MEHSLREKRGKPEGERVRGAETSKVGLFSPARRGLAKKEEVTMAPNHSGATRCEDWLPMSRQ